MGDVADDLFDNALSLDIKYIDDDKTCYMGYHYSDMWDLYIKRKLKWITKTDEKIPVQKLDNNHLLNILNLIDNQDNNHGKGKSTFLDILYFEKKNRNI